VVTGSLSSRASARATSGSDALSAVIGSAYSSSSSHATRGGQAQGIVSGSTDATASSDAATWGRAISMVSDPPGGHAVAVASGGGEATAIGCGFAWASLFGESWSSGSSSDADLPRSYATFGGQASATESTATCSGIAYAVAQDGASCLSISPFALIAKRVAQFLA
jgi:hypothetical protein